jgi:HEPN domain-containing protein
VDEFIAWFHQAKADREAAEVLASARAQLGVCHAIAKWQQTVEKAIKSIVACLRDAGILHIDIGYQHGVERFFSVLIRLPRARDNRLIQQQLHGFLDQQTRAGLMALDALVPRRPTAGGGPQRNTEYPFLEADGQWTYPAADSVFSQAEITQFRSLAKHVLDKAGRIISALRRRSR